jgi:AraC-like DNA-binding protein
MLVGAMRLEPGHWLPEHVHRHTQILWTPRGVVAVEAGDRRWVLPPDRALWLPSGTWHRTGSSRGALLHGVYLGAESSARGPGEPSLLAVRPLLAELFRHLARTDLDADPRSRAEAVLLDMLEPLPSGPLELRYPTDPRAASVAAALRDDPADPRGLPAFARAAGTSPRTLSRLFVAETGLSFDRWRARVRMWAALPLLADGEPVSRVAHAVGYATPSAFLAAFRRTVGISPTRYLTGPDS